MIRPPKRVGQTHTVELIKDRVPAPLASRDPCGPLLRCRADKENTPLCSHFRQGSQVRGHSVTSMRRGLFAIFAQAAPSAKHPQGPKIMQRCRSGA